MESLGLDKSNGMQKKILITFLFKEGAGPVFTFGNVS